MISSLLRKRVPVIGVDRDGPNGGYRAYMVAGASHVGTRGPVSDGLRAFGTLDNLPKGAQVSEFPQNEVFSPAHQFLINWVVNGVAPPRARPIEIVNGEIVRDANGNAKGGVRSPYVDLATNKYVASIPPQGTLYGLQEPFSAAQMRKMYRTRAAYLAEFDKQIDRCWRKAGCFRITRPR